MADHTKTDLGFYPTEIYLYARGKHSINGTYKHYVKVSGKWKLEKKEDHALTTEKYLNLVSKHWDHLGSSTRRSFGPSHYGTICKELTRYDPTKTEKIVWSFTSRRV